MTVVHKPYIIFDIELIKKAEMKAMGMTLKKNPDIDMYRIKAILKTYIEQTKKGYKALEKLGHGKKVDDLTKEYLEQQEAFTVYLPVTAKTLEWNKYHLGSEIRVAYYPDNVWATFHTDDEPDNNNDFNRMKEGR